MAVDAFQVSGRSLSFMHTVLNLAVEPEAETALRPALSFLSSHLSLESEQVAGALATLHFRPYEDFRPPAGDGVAYSPVKIRWSSAAAFNLQGMKAVVGDREVVDCPNTGTGFVFDPGRRLIEVWISERSEIQVVEFLRDLIIRAEERCGTLVLHAAAAVWKGAAVLVIGGKGAGKSTLLLDLVTRPGWRFLSGDKVFLELAGGGVLAHGWPDYPHLGHATMLRHPALKRAAEDLGHRVDPAGAAKILLRPEVLQRALGFEYARGGVPLRWVIFPHVLGSRDTSFVPLAPGPGERSGPELVVENLEWTAQSPLAGWHSFVRPLPVAEALSGPVPRLSRLLQDCRYYRMEGPGPLPPQALEALLP